MNFRVIDQGRLIAQGTLAVLRAQVGAGDVSLEDVFLSLIAEPQPEAAPDAAGAMSPA